MGVRMIERFERGADLSPRRQEARLYRDALFAVRGKPFQNGFAVSFNGKPRDELLIENRFYFMPHALVVPSGRRRDYNEERPYSQLSWMVLAKYRRPLSTASRRAALGQGFAPSLFFTPRFAKHPITSGLSLRQDESRRSRHRMRREPPRARNDAQSFRCGYFGRPQRTAR